MTRSSRKLREPSGLCRWRHCGLCTRNTVANLHAELIARAVDLELAVAREADAMGADDVHRLDRLLQDLWIVRSSMASSAGRNGSPVNDQDSMLFPSVQARLDQAIRREQSRTARCEKGVSDGM